MNFIRDWKEEYIDEMGLIVALSGIERYARLAVFKLSIKHQLTKDEQHQLRFAIKNRFTPTNGQDGCRSGMEAVKEVV